MYRPQFLRTAGSTAVWNIEYAVVDPTKLKDELISIVLTDEPSKTWTITGSVSNELGTCLTDVEKSLSIGIKFKIKPTAEKSYRKGDRYVITTTAQATLAVSVTDAAREGGRFYKTGPVSPHHESFSRFQLGWKTVLDQNATQCTHAYWDLWYENLDPLDDIKTKEKVKEPEKWFVTDFPRQAP
jgi:hypothetical protein